MPEKEYKPTEELEAKEGYVKDPVSGRLVKITPERVEAKIIFAHRLLSEYGYSKEQIQTFPEFYIQKGSTKIGPADMGQKIGTATILFGIKFAHRVSISYINKSIRKIN